MSIYCPNCGQDRTGSDLCVCNVCGKVFCPDCYKRGKHNFMDTACPRCGQVSYNYVSDWSQIMNAMKNSQN